MAKVLKLASGVPSGKLKEPPKSCIPRRAKMRMNKKSRNNREMIDLIELSSEITRLRREAQYLREETGVDYARDEDSGEGYYNISD